MRRIRGAAELAADIEKYDLLTQWVEKKRHVLKTKEDADAFFEGRNCSQRYKAEVYSCIEAGQVVCNDVTLTRLQPANQANGRAALRCHIEEAWTVAEILFFRSFLHGGLFQSPEGWEVNYCGITFKTPTEDRELERMWSGLVSRAYLLMGAICGAGTHKGASMKFGHADFDSLLGYTMSQLAQLVPEDILARLARLEKPEPKPKRRRLQPKTVTDAIDLLCEAGILSLKSGLENNKRTLRRWIANPASAPVDGFVSPVEWESFLLWVNAARSKAKFASGIREHMTVRANTTEAAQLKRGGGVLKPGGGARTIRTQWGN